MKWSTFVLLCFIIALCDIQINCKKMLTSVLLKDRTAFSHQLFLPKMTIDAKHSLKDYYPIFLQTHILKSEAGFKDPEMTRVCSNKNENDNCEICDKATMNICYKCARGFYKFKGKCFNTCPKNHVADIFRRECHPLSNRNVLAQITYSKAFTTSSCTNQCGKKFDDCSCELDCATQGNCCTDFNSCEQIIMKNKGFEKECKSRERRLGKCDFCDFEKDTCVQCEDGKYLREGKCVSMCNDSDRVFSQNKLCLLQHDCGIDYCAECLPENTDRCKQCINGYFLFNGQCLSKCPLKYRADRISWQCIDTPIYAWYWIFPSKASCRGRCNYKQSKLYSMDCSCEEDCYRSGDCCMDFEDECPQFVFWK